MWKTNCLSSRKSGGCCRHLRFWLVSGSGGCNVQISGQIDTYIESYTAGDQNTVRLSSGGGAGGSRVTFSATEKINGPTEAFMRLEMGVLTDQGTSSGTPDVNWIFERETVVGVRGEFGSLSFGRQYTPHFMSLPMNEAAGQSLGSAIGAFGIPGIVSTNGIGWLIPISRMYPVLVSRQPAWITRFSTPRRIFPGLRGRS